MCFSDEEPGTEGPRRVSQPEIREAFPGGMVELQRIDTIRFESLLLPEGPKFSPGGPKAWLVATLERT